MVNTLILKLTLLSVAEIPPHLVCLYLDFSVVLLGLLPYGGHEERLWDLLTGTASSSYTDWRHRE